MSDIKDNASSSLNMAGSMIDSFIQHRMAEPVKNLARDTGIGRNVWKGALAGLIGGVAGTAAKTLAEKVYPPRTHGEPEPPDVLADKVAGHHLDEPTQAVASEAIHWGFGGAVGAAYGALVEFYPVAAGKQGANFGMTLMAITHEGALPAMGLSADPTDQTSREKSSEMATHIVYGIVTEMVRSVVRKML